jgi:hypothetical protein
MGLLTNCGVSRGGKIGKCRVQKLTALLPLQRDISDFGPAKRNIPNEKEKLNKKDNVCITQQ